MDLFERVSFVAPDHLTGSIALGLRRYFPHVSVTCVGDADTNETCLLKGIASKATQNLKEGLSESNLIFLGKQSYEADAGPEDVIQLCQKDATICGHGHSLAKMSAIIGESSRSDIHFISLTTRNSVAMSGDVSHARAEDLRSAQFSLTPGSMEDLDALSQLQATLQRTGANIMMMSPRVHDRRLTDSILLPRLMLIPLIEYLLESAVGKEHALTPETVRLFDVFSGFSPGEPENWERELNYNRNEVLGALKKYQNSLISLTEEVKAGHIAKRLPLLVNQVSDLTSVLLYPSEPTPVVELEPSTESLLSLMDTLVKAIDDMENHGPGDSGTITIQMLRSLAEETQHMAERVVHNLPLAQPAEVSEVESVASVLAETVVAPSVAPAIYEAPQPEPVVAEYSSQVYVAPQQPTFNVFEAPEDVIEDVIEEEVEEVVEPVVEKPMPRFHFEPEEPKPIVHVPVAEDLPQLAPAHPAADEPSGGSELILDESALSEGKQWDLVVHDRPELQTMQRMARVLAAARVAVRMVDRSQTAEGIPVLCLSLSNPAQTARAREVLQRAGITFE